MTGRAAAPPRVVLALGLLGIVPFWSIPAAAWLQPEATGVAATLVAIYAALILSFLGGARWGLAVREIAPDAGTVALAMTPTLAAVLVIAVGHGDVRLQLLGLAAALTLSWAWDVHADGLPPWYGRLRTMLTLGAVGGLCVGLLLLRG